MRYSKPLTTQRAVPARFIPISNQETAVCPWCHDTAVGQYTGGGLSADEWCSHFQGWVDGSDGQPVALFMGLASDLDE